MIRGTPPPREVPTRSVTVQPSAVEELRASLAGDALSPGRGPGFRQRADLVSSKASLYELPNELAGTSKRLLWAPRGASPRARSEAASGTAAVCRQHGVRSRQEPRRGLDKGRREGALKSHAQSETEASEPARALANAEKNENSLVLACFLGIKVKSLPLIRGNRLVLTRGWVCIDPSRSSRKPHAYKPAPQTFCTGSRGHPAQGTASLERCPLNGVHGGGAPREEAHAYRPTGKQAIVRKSWGSHREQS